ncbi:MAG: AmmeMemoRadiSam system radical SAM enzyme [Candidatus Nanohaloarchaeota archaeon]|nr:AmmeMemoRadiSam system radical SAM enzyme [Candidatus Nanohaloarchaeota archaeon]
MELLYEKLPDAKIKCLACKHYCIIPENKTGICHVRANIKGELMLLTHRMVAAKHLDPIEKKPFYHVLPQTLSYSLGTFGCNFRCLFCQNWQLSQIIKEVAKYDAFKASKFIQTYSSPFSPEEVVEKALQLNAKSIAYTYNEPTIWVEGVKEIAVLAKKHGLKNLMVSSGYESEETLNLLEEVDAYNIDLKSFSSEFYINIVGSKLENVLETIESIHKRKKWIEITTLLIPGKNNDEKELEDMASFIAGIDKNIPWHISRFHPDYKMTDVPPTPIKELEKAIRIGEEAGLNYVYIGNVPGHEKENTYCPCCNKIVIERSGYEVKNHLIKGKCPYCSCKLAGIWE